MSTRCRAAPLLVVAEVTHEAALWQAAAGHDPLEDL